MKKYIPGIIFLLFVFFLSCTNKNPTQPSAKQQDNTAPTASFTVSPITGTIATIFNFDASECMDHEDSSSALQVRWDWENDGTWDTDYATTRNATHQYLTTGTKTINLQVRDSGHLTDTTTQQVTVGAANNAPTASFVVTPAFGTLATVFNFDASSCSDIEDPISILQIRWDWENDGIWDTNYSTIKITTHQYSSPGSITIRMQVMDSGGLTNTFNRQIAITGPAAETGTVMDIDGNIYVTIKIGTQWWMAENLKVTRYNNGEPIFDVKDNSQWSDLTFGAFCSFNNNQTHTATYGLLYNWYAVKDSRKIAPEGWHVSTDDDWKKLELSLGMSQKDVDDTGWRGTYEGEKLKTTGTLEEGTGLWHEPNTGSSNESGLSVLPAGYRATTGVFANMGYSAYFWSPMKSEDSLHGFRYLFYYYSSIFRQRESAGYGFSVRCVED